MSHQDLAKHLRGEYQISPWLSQIVTITCDQKKMTSQEASGLMNIQ